MTERDRSAVHIHLLVRDIDVLHGGHGHDGERFIDLEQIDVVNGHPRALEDQIDRFPGCSREPLRLVRRSSLRDDASHRLEVILLRVVRRCDHQS